MKVAVSCGDINGVALEVFLGALQIHTPQKLAEQDVELLLAAETQSLRAGLKQLDADAELHDTTLHVHGHSIGLIECTTVAQLRPGALQADAGALALEALERVADLALDGTAQAVLTLPVNKKALHLAGADFPGQTEFFAGRAAVEHPVMILCSRELRVGLATIHIPLRRVAEAVTRAAVERGVTQLDLSLRRDFGFEHPRIAVLGLNPHAGEEGDIGREEIEVISPVLESMRRTGVTLEGPYPADGFFAHGAWRNFDGVLAMYHDQGLIPLKMLAGGGGVNFTGGLPFVRTSPDHGTAFGIAGKWLADPRACAEALIQAVHMVNARADYDARTGHGRD